MLRRGHVYYLNGGPKWGRDRPAVELFLPYSSEMDPLGLIGLVQWRDSIYRNPPYLNR